VEDWADCVHNQWLLTLTELIAPFSAHEVSAETADHFSATTRCRGGSLFSTAWLPQDV
jgi:hypothetical protein